jgi:hypothetical protein
MFRSSLCSLAFAAFPLLLPAQARLTAGARFAPPAAKPGDEVLLEVAIEIADGYHVCGSKDEHALKLAATDAGGLQTQGAPDFPDGERHEAGGVTSYHVAGKAVLKQRYKVPADARPGVLVYRGALEYVACSATASDPPAKTPFEARLRVGAADRAPATSAPIRTDATTMLLPAGHIGLRELIDATATFLQWNILFAPSELQQSASGSMIELQTPMPVDAKSCEEVVSELLYNKGFVLLARNRERHMFEVVFIPGQRGREVMSGAETRTPDEVLARPTLKQPVSVVVPLQNTNATIATNALRPFFAQAGGAGGAGGLTLGTTGTNNALLITGIQSQVADAIRLLRKVDGDTAGAAGAAAGPAGPGPAAGGPGGAGPAPALGDRISALEKAVQELTATIQALQKQLAERK